METKQCTACGQEKPQSAFTKRAGKSGRRGTCRSCMRRRKRETTAVDSLFHADSGSAAEASASGSGLTVAVAVAVGQASTAETRAAVAVTNTETASAASAASETSPPSRTRKRKRKRRRGRYNKAARLRKQQDTDQPAEVSEAQTPVRPPDRVIKQIQGSFTFATSVLNDRGRGHIRLRGYRETGKRWSTVIPTEMAVRMVEEGAAGIINSGMIHKLYTKSDFRLLILQRDDYICRYCGKFGDTIDHVMPKSKGGLSSPANCVCACSECNLKKADKLDFVNNDDF
ncbi:HNH endonuclease [Paenibacillus taihuensis]|uniref:HNH endonuclease n=1 Tax=Paenibacillus taihuensis TaxID=1156355 RepID=A0A3D9SJ07_9BACL|nr:HNH endonuclease signature motif containing protein [Paenibacillus taihuensis]REE92853.1 HNH endonuclease [Paenibacillus taihuensis]